MSPSKSVEPGAQRTNNGKAGDSEPDPRKDGGPATTSKDEEEEPYTYRDVDSSRIHPQYSPQLQRNQGIAKENRCVYSEDLWNPSEVEATN